MQGISLEDLRQSILISQLKDEVSILEIDEKKIDEILKNVDFDNYYVNKTFFKQYNFSLGAITNER